MVFGVNTDKIQVDLKSNVFDAMPYDEEYIKRINFDLIKICFIYLIGKLIECVSLLRCRTRLPSA